MTYIEKLPDGERVVGIIVFRERVYVATTLGVYRLSRNTLKPLKFDMTNRDLRS